MSAQLTELRVDFEAAQGAFDRPDMAPAEEARSQIMAVPYVETRQPDQEQGPAATVEVEPITVAMSSVKSSARVYPAPAEGSPIEPRMVNANVRRAPGGTGFLSEPHPLAKEYDRAKGTAARGGAGGIERTGISRLFGQVVK
jgi:hypothetical protein